MRAVQRVGYVHMCVALLTGRVHVDILVSLEDWILLSVGVELCKLSLALQSWFSCRVVLYSVVVDNPRIVVRNKNKIVHTSCVLCTPCGDELLMIYFAGICC
jgi:hypothetical protein